jgi:drug/metabolite transporter (DMT)-like permease
MIIALIQTFFACFLWGAIFAIPLYLKDFNCVDIVLGRFFVYGSLSFGTLLFYLFIKRQSQFLKYWKQAAFSAAIMNLLYFASLTLGIRFSSASLMTLMMGTCPITVIVYSALIRRETHILSMFLWPSIAIVVGLLVMSSESIMCDANDATCLGYVQGLICGSIALATWTWFVVFNGEFMKKHPDINPFQWTTLMGVITLIYTTIIISGKYITFGKEHFYQFHWEHETGRMFITGALILGFLCSWIAFALWNAANVRLPPVLAGQLSIMETIFGLIFIFFIQQTLPSTLQFFGIVLILLGIFYALYYFMKYDQQKELENIPK